MLQEIEGRNVFVVDLPENPISLLPITDNSGEPKLAPYVWALNVAIRQGIVTEPGKYGIEVSATDWNIYAINE